LVPSGMTNLTRLSRQPSSLAHCIVIGIVAAEELVPNLRGAARARVACRTQAARAARKQWRAGAAHADGYNTLQR